MVKHVLLLLMLKTVLVLNICLETLYFFQDYLMNRKVLKKFVSLFETEIYVTFVINVFKVTLDQFNASLLN